MMRKNINNLFSGILHYKSREIHRIQRFLDPTIILILYIITCQEVDQINFKLSEFLIKSFTIFFLNYFILNRFGLYSSFRQKSLRFLAQRITTGWAFSIFLLLIINNFLNFGIDFSEGKIVLWSILSLLILSCTNLSLRLILKFHRTQGGNSKRIIYWGDYESAKEFEKQLLNNKSLGMNLVAWFSPSKPNEQIPFEFLKRFGGDLKDMSIWLKKNKIDKIFFSDINDKKYLTRDVIKILGDTYREVVYAPIWAQSNMKFSFSTVGNQPCLNIWDSSSSIDYIDLMIKRVFDFSISFIGIILISPLLIIISVAIKLTSDGPIFFKQERYGQYGEKFLIFKFRSMKVIESGSTPYLKQATREDDRTTPLGSFLRKWSLDELPQLFNVLRGDMSLVGPRPHAVSHNESYRKIISGYMQRHTLKPGMTGLAQIEGFRGETRTKKDMEKRIDADLRYKKDWSLTLDIIILLKTIFKIRSKNAY